jgi:hypothetical protein
VPFIGELAALATAFFWSLTAIFFSFSGRLVGSDVVNRTRLLFALVFITLTHVILQKSLFPFDTEPFRWGGWRFRASWVLFWVIPFCSELMSWSDRGCRC